MGVLRGEKVRLTGYRDDDYPVYIKWSEDEEVMRYLSVRPIAPDSEKGLRDWIESTLKSHNAYTFAVRPLHDETPVGNLMLNNIQWSHHSTNLAIFIGPEYQGTGYGRDTMEIALHYAFHELGMFRVELYVFAYNTRAISLYERVGFVREGALRQSIHRDGRRYDTYVYGILRDEWAAARQDSLPPPLGS